jgi:uncharacterized repeat protein (TIGR02543 family)
MKIMLSWRRHHHVAMVRILLIMLIMAALIAGMVGCGGGGGVVVEYDLTITSTDGGSVTIPGEGTFTYDEQTVVNLAAEPEEGYRFVEWTGDAGRIDNVDAAITIINMEGNYSITANFGPEYIPMVAAGGYHTVGLKHNGRVVAMGDNDYGQCNVGSWTDIVQVAAGRDHTVGLKSDGTLIAVGNNWAGPCDVGG